MRIHWNSLLFFLLDKWRDKYGVSSISAWKFIFTVCFFCLFATSHPVFAQSITKTKPQVYSAEELVAGLTETLTSIDSLYCEFTQVQKMDNQILDSRRCIYARFGNKWHLTEFSIANDKVSEEGSTVCFDGERAYTYTKSKSPDGTVRFSAVQIHDFQMTPLLSPEYMLGMRLSNLNRSIPDVCQANQATSVTAEAIDGGQLYRLLINGVPNGTNSTGMVYAYDVTCELDPSHGMLPTEILVEYSPETKKNMKNSQFGFQRWRIEMFQNVLDEYSDMERLFPVKGILEQKRSDKQVPSFELILDNIRLNSNLEENLFNPEIPAGTTIFDVTTEGRGRVSFAGGTTVVDRKINELVDSAQAAKQRSSAFSWIVAVNFVFLTFVAVALWWKYKSKKS